MSRKFDRLRDPKQPHPSDPKSPTPKQFQGKTVREVERQIERNRDQENR